MKKRLKFKCWNCEREYSLTRDLQGQPRLIVECPFCEREAVVDLAPYRSEAVGVYKGEAESGGAETITLPDVIPTSPLSEQ
jgi:hypothetical protein